MNDFQINNVGNEMFGLIKKLFPICRSITGNGVRESLAIIKKIIPLEIFEIPTGTQVFDWKIPKEWNIKDAWIKDSSGNKIVNFKNSNLHIVSYSVPIHEKMNLDELKKYLHYIEEYPDWIPYKTSYYNETWGFCISHKQFESLEEGEYEIFIDSKLENGNLTYGEFFVKGEKEDEILITCYICHPSMCNDNLSGVSLVTFLAKSISNLKPTYSYRFLFIPETIGAITWLSKNEKILSKIKSTLVVTCVGDKGISCYKKTKNGNSTLDIIVKRVLEESKDEFKIVDFFPYGSDERQFSSPGINIQTGSLTRTPYNHFSEYHTSADNLEFMSKTHLADSFKKYYKIFELLEKENLDIKNIKKISKNDKNEHYINSNPKCEPNLGRRGLYRTLHNKSIKMSDLAIFWILNYSDGFHSLSEISDLSKIDYNIIKENVKILEEKNLVHKLKEYF
jgi:aminopeptidase-like protein